MFKIILVTNLLLLLGGCAKHKGKDKLVSVNILNHAPTPTADFTIRVLPGIKFSFNIPAGTDIDGDTLSYSIVTPPAAGTLENCLGLNSTPATDLDCNYTPTVT